jgi:hypothetical protein
VAAFHTQQSEDIGAPQTRFYRMAFNPSDPGPGNPSNPPRPFVPTGPPIRIKQHGGAGTGTGRFPFQVATSITLRTGWPKHWGRFYVPNPAYAIDADGRIPATHRQFLADEVWDFKQEVEAANFLIATPVSQVSRQKAHGLLGVNAVVVDDIPDVIRRRRPKQAAARSFGV